MNMTRPPSDDDLKSARPIGPAARRQPRVCLLAYNAADYLRRAFHDLSRPARTPAPPFAPLALAVIMAAVIACVASMFFLDAAVSDWALHLPLWFVNVFEQITDFGHGSWTMVPLAFIFLCVAALQSPNLSRMTAGVLAALSARAGFAFLAIGAPGLFVTIIKRVIGRARPYVGDHDDPFAYMPFAWRSDFASMPSGHSTTAAAAAIAIGAVWPRARWVMWIYASVIMFSRVAILAHHPSDVIAGAVVGAVGAGLVRRWFASRGLVFGARDLRVRAGPSLRRIKAAVFKAAGAL